MNAEDQNQNFDKLLSLLKLKRHEQPPPRFFNDFSSKVTTRLRAGDVGRLESFEDIVAQAPWLQRIWQAIEGKPAVSGVFAAAVCGVLLTGIFLSEKLPTALPTLAEIHSPVDEPATASLFATSPFSMPTLVSSTNPAAVLPGGSLFGTVPSLQTLPASGVPMSLELK